MMDPDLPSYIITNSFKFKGSLNREIFGQSLEKLVQRHDILFSVFKEKNSEPYCEIIPHKVDFEFIDYTSLQEDEKIKKVNQFILDDIQVVFDLANGPMFRFFLIKTASDEYYFHSSIHHIVFDGWSWSVFANDLTEIYNSLLKGKEIALENIEFQEYDYARWEKSPAGIKNEEKLKKFWEENLKGASSILNFPYDYKRKDKASGKGACEDIKLPQELTEKLKAICKAEGSSLFTTLFSVFGVQMQKYSGEDDFNIGLPVAYRPHSKLEKIFGMFVNTVVVRLKYEKGQSFKSVIQNTNEAVMNAIDNQNLAFDKVVELAKPERMINVNPLFQVAFAWQNNLEMPIKMEGIESERFAIQEMATEFDITLSLWEIDGAIGGTFEYNLDLLKRETILRLRDNFISLLEKLTANSNESIDEVSMITDEEIALINKFNDTKSEYPRDKTIVQVFEDQVRKYPDKKAVIFNNDSLTYKQLNDKANQLANRLRESGVKANNLVALLTDKSVDMMVGMMGILKAGAGYVPIDPEYPEERMKFIFGDSGCKILITHKKYRDLPLDGITKYFLDAEETYHSDNSDPVHIITPMDLAYIIYTSGTTGTPKGSLIPHRGVVRLVCNTNYIEFKPEDNVLQTAAIVFDASTEEIFGALLNGSTLHIIDKQTVLDPNLFGDVLEKNNITIVDLSSALFTQIAEIRTDIFDNVRTLVLGGDVVSAPHVNKLRKSNHNITVLNTYGPTENSCNSTAYAINRDFDYNIPIGKPISNSTAYIFDKNMKYQPIGIVGELYVGGDGVSLGYLNRDDLNKKSFVDNPYNRGERLYKTGDLVKWLPDGNIEFHGRNDNQIKIRGFRIELEEIESTISDLDDIIETVIKPVKIQEGNYKLVAFLNVPESFKKDVSEIDKIIKAKLPAYMVPSAYRLMNGFPKNINGKIDRKALHIDIKDLEPGSGKKKETASMSETEKVIFKIWSEALQTEDFEINDSFFEVGGNSLLAISVFSKIQSAFNQEMPLRIFFDSPRIKDLAETIDLKRSSRSIITETTEMPKDKNIISGEI